MLFTKAGGLNMVGKRNGLYLVIAAGMLILGFQNCGQAQFDDAQSLGRNLGCQGGECSTDTANGSDPNTGGGGGGGVPDSSGPSKGPVADSQSFSFGAVSNKVDILIVVDDSGSMSAEQKNLATHFSDFIGSLSGIDWQIAVTSTDVCPDNNIYPGTTAPDPKCAEVPAANHARGRFLGPQGVAPHYSPNYIMKALDNNVSDTFARTIQRNTEQGSGDERAIFAANLVLDGKDDPLISKNFFRDESNLAIVILSDEDERSVGGNKNSDQYRPLESYDLPQTLITRVNSIFSGAKSLVVDAIAWKPGTKCANASVEGKVYEMLVNATKGVFGSICDTGTYTNDLSNISKNILDVVNSKTLTLNFVPLATPVVKFVPEPMITPITFMWSPGTRQVILSERPAAGTKVQVEYIHL